MKKMRSMINDERDGKHEIIRIFLCIPLFCLSIILYVHIIINAIHYKYLFWVFMIFLFTVIRVVIIMIILFL